MVCYGMPHTPPARVALVTQIPGLELVAYSVPVCLCDYVMTLASVSYISLFSKPARKQTPEPYIVLQALQCINW